MRGVERCNESGTMKLLRDVEDPTEIGGGDESGFSGTQNKQDGCTVNVCVITNTCIYIHIYRKSIISRSWFTQLWKLASQKAVEQTSGWKLLDTGRCFSPLALLRTICLT